MLKWIYMVYCYGVQSLFCTPYCKRRKSLCRSFHHPKKTVLIQVWLLLLCFNRLQMVIKKRFIYYSHKLPTAYMVFYCLLCRIEKMQKIYCRKLIFGYECMQDSIQTKANHLPGCLQLQETWHWCDCENPRDPPMKT